MKIIFTIFAVILFSTSLLAQDENPTIQKEVLIAHSGKDYTKAMAIAKKLSTQLKLKLDLRGLKPNKELGLSDSKKNCEEGFGFFPCYVPRGHYEDGSYISIEYSDSFEGFAKGYYIVVVAHYQTGNSAIKTLLTKTKKIIPDAYIKRTSVYTGCIH